MGLVARASGAVTAEGTLDDCPRQLKQFGYRAAVGTVIEWTAGYFGLLLVAGGPMNAGLLN